MFYHHSLVLSRASFPSLRQMVDFLLWLRRTFHTMLLIWLYFFSDFPAGRSEERLVGDVKGPTLGVAFQTVLPAHFCIMKGRKMAAARSVRSLSPTCTGLCWNLTAICLFLPLPHCEGQWLYNIGTALLGTVSILSSLPAAPSNSTNLSR